MALSKSVHVTQRKSTSALGLRIHVAASGMVGSSLIGHITIKERSVHIFVVHEQEISLTGIMIINFPWSQENKHPFALEYFFLSIVLVCVYTLSLNDCCHSIYFILLGRSGRSIAGRFHPLPVMSV